MTSHCDSTVPWKAPSWHTAVFFFGACIDFSCLNSKMQCTAVAENIQIWGLSHLESFPPVTVISSNPLMEHKNLLTENIWPQAPFSHDQSSVHIILYKSRSLLWSIVSSEQIKGQLAFPREELASFIDAGLYIIYKTWNPQQTLPGGCRCCEFDVGLRGDSCCHKESLLMELDATIVGCQSDI